MQVINSSRIGIAQGSVDLFSDFEEGAEMWTGEGSRARSQWIAFDQKFAVPPMVHVSLTLWDMDSAHNVRADLAAENISCQRRSKIRPRGGAKLGHFGFTRDAGDERRPVSRALHVAGG